MTIITSIQKTPITRLELDLAHFVDTAKLHQTKVGLLADLIIDGHHFAPNSEGYWSLNDIHATLGLEDNKQPWRWRTKIAFKFRCLQILDAPENNDSRLQILDARPDGITHLINDAAGNLGEQTLASEAATIAYAMWVSDEFYMLVIHGFALLRSIAISSAQTRKGGNDAFQAKLAGHGITVSEMARSLDIKLPNHLLAFCIARYTRMESCDPDVRKVKDNWKGFFRHERASNYGARQQFRVLTKGYEHFRDNKPKMLGLFAEYRLMKGQLKGQSKR